MIRAEFWDPSPLFLAPGYDWAERDTLAHAKAWGRDRLRAVTASPNAYVILTTPTGRWHSSRARGGAIRWTPVRF